MSVVAVVIIIITIAIASHLLLLLLPLLLLPVTFFFSSPQHRAYENYAWSPKEKDVAVPSSLKTKRVIILVVSSFFRFLDLSFCFLRRSRLPPFAASPPPPRPCARARVCV